jgi:hypothetical protein
VKKYKPWTSRDVQFNTYGKISDDEYETFSDALIEKFWDRWFWRTIGIGSHGAVFELTGFPWWVPGWLARRAVADVAYGLNIGGDATFVVSRSVLKNQVEAGQNGLDE